jgi:hypothetical protein
MVASKDKPASAPKHSDETDVEGALARKTQDGPGTDPLPKSDFHSFATAGVEKGDLLSVEDVTREVLAGRWGVTTADAMNKLEEAGYDVDAVWAQFQKRKAGGAPSAF